MNSPPTPLTLAAPLSRTARPRVVRTRSSTSREDTTCSAPASKILETLSGSPSHTSAPRYGAASRQQIALQHASFVTDSTVLAPSSIRCNHRSVSRSDHHSGNRESEFRQTHAITGGTRPLHITATPSGAVFWGEHSTTPNAMKSTSTARRMREQPGASPTLSPKAQSATCTTSFTIPGDTASGF